MSYSIPKKVYEKFIAPYQQWKDMKFVEHGLGLLRLEEHEELVKIGAIKCYKGKGEDSILAEYPKLVVKDRDEEKTMDMNGDLFQITQERDALHKQGKYARIDYFPRKWTNWMESRKKEEPPMNYEEEEVKKVWGQQEMTEIGQILPTF